VTGTRFFLGASSVLALAQGRVGLALFGFVVVGLLVWADPEPHG
jgi:hypothetical protein